MRTGAFATEAVVHASQIVPLPDDMPAEIGALIACGVITGYGAVFNTARLMQGQSAAVIGCGGVGLNVIQSAALAGAQPLIALDPNPMKREAALQFGASHVIDPLADGAAQQLLALTENRGADFVFVATGNASAMDSAQAMLAQSGAIVIV